VFSKVLFLHFVEIKHGTGIVFLVFRKGAIINFTKEVGTGTVPKKKYRVANQPSHMEPVKNRKLRIYMSHKHGVEERVNRN
jgi:hypothetical protein